MKSLKIFLSLTFVVFSTSAFGYQTCTSSEGQQMYANVEKDAGDIEAVVLSYLSHPFIFYPRGEYFVLDRRSSQSPGFSTIRISSHGFDAYQVSDTGVRRWLPFLCR